MATLVSQQPKSGEAFRCLERAEKDNPDLREANYLIGRVYQESGWKTSTQRVYANGNELAEKALSRQLD